MSRIETIGEARRVLPLLLVFLLVAATACRHNCRVSGRLQARFSVPSCCFDQSRYFWDNTVKDCVELRSWGGQNCGCVCHGEDCDRLFWSRDECRKEYAHCR